MNHAWTLTKSRMLLAVRNRLFLFFSLVMPLVFLFLYAGLFARGNPLMVSYMFGPVLAVTVMGSFWGLSVQLVMFRERGVLRRFHVAPVSASALLASSILSNYFLTLPTVAIEFLLVRLIWGVRDFGNLWGVLVFVTFGTVTFASLGLIVASVTNTMQETQVLNQIIWLIFLFLSGATLPLAVLPGWIQGVALYLPATYLVSGLRQAMVRSVSVWTLGANLIALAGCAAIAFFISAQLFRWEPEAKVTGRAKAWAAATILPFLLLGAWESTRGHLRSDEKADFDSVQRREAPRSPSR